VARTAKHYGHTPNALARRLRKLRAGIKKVFAVTKELDLTGTPTSQPDAIALIDRRLMVFDAVDALQVAIKRAFQDRQAALRPSLDLLQQLEAAVVAGVGEHSPELREFGLKPKKAPTYRSARDKADAADKGTRTRKAKEEALEAAKRKRS